MGQRRMVRHGLLACATAFLVGLAWQALAGGFRQLARSRTPGQQVETVTQIGCGVLSLLVIVTTFWRRHLAQPVRTAWSLSLAASAGLSGLVWGPPMPHIAALLVALAMVLSRAVQWALQSGFEE
ncbi:MAG: hypothetical protein HY835_14315 [Anaerolineae bacterium]|nr:hypothetical protein [Anaerolineae bacterium]